MEDTCANCGKALMDEYEAWSKTQEMRIFYGQDTQYSFSPCCENAKKATKNDIVIKILNDL